MSALSSIEALGWELVRRPGTRPAFRRTCPSDGTHVEVSTQGHPSPDYLHKLLMSRGWTSKSGKYLCPECSKGRWTKRLAEIEANSNEKETENDMATVTPIKQDTASDAAKKARRLVYAALEDYYDDAAKCYRDAHTDASVAAELGVSESFVKATRESDFGPIKEPTEISQMRTDMAALQSELGKLRTRFDSLCSKQGWRQ